MEEAHVPEITRTSQAINAIFDPLEKFVMDIRATTVGNTKQIDAVLAPYNALTRSVFETMQRKDIIDLTRTVNWEQFNKAAIPASIELAELNDNLDMLHNNFTSLFNHAREIYQVARAARDACIKHQASPEVVLAVVSVAMDRIIETAAQPINSRVPLMTQYITSLKEAGDKLQKAYDDIVPFLPSVQ